MSFRLGCLILCVRFFRSRNDESVYQIWEKMLEKREHISIIIDEYGSLRGVVSMEDIIETMTGVEIVDEDDVAVDMQALAKEKSIKMLQNKKKRF